ncbi:50S ribosomal protein L21 [Patescibacteria group bacterium]|nr:50S ribosomal protein L21 [Patescibacteria group bacterium]
MYAIIDFKGTQIKIAEGDQVKVPKLDQKEGTELKIENVLLINHDGNVEVGIPVVKNALVTATVLEHFKGKKIRVATYKAKSRYRKVKGFRPQLSKIAINSISFSQKNAVKEPKTASKKRAGSLAKTKKS